MKKYEAPNISIAFMVPKYDVLTTSGEIDIEWDERWFSDDVFFE